MLTPDACCTSRIVDQVAGLILNWHPRDVLLPTVVALGREPQSRQAAPIGAASDRTLLEQLETPVNCSSHANICLLAEDRHSVFAELSITLGALPDFPRLCLPECFERCVPRISSITCTPRQTQTILWRALPAEPASVACSQRCSGMASKRAECLQGLLHHFRKLDGLERRVVRFCED
jgi:hypothetical protein